MGLNISMAVDGIEKTLVYRCVRDKTDSLSWKLERFGAPGKLHQLEAQQLRQIAQLSSKLATDQQATWFEQLQKWQDQKLEQEIREREESEGRWWPADPTKGSRSENNP